MHDRRIDGEAHTFGNYGALYKNAMTWYDHETRSTWSQPIGTGLAGPYEGVRLEMIPTEVVPWETWRREHPDTVVLDVGARPFGPRGLDPFGGTRGDYVVGVALGDVAKAYPFDVVSQRIAVNDAVGDLPVVVYANPEDRSVHIFVRRVGESTLTMRWSDGRLVDEETGTRWDPSKGLGREGPLAGELLKELPYSTAYDWAWRDFYPHTEEYRP